MRIAPASRSLRTSILLGLPLALRLICLFQLRTSPFFTELFVDARTYHDMAVQLVQGTFQRATPFWQPPLYPYFLALVYKLFGPQPLAAQLLQAVLGSFTCLLVFRLGDRLFGRTAAWIAWAVSSGYALLIYFDLQILNAGLGVFFMVLGLDCLARAVVPPAADGKPPAPAHAARPGLFRRCLSWRGLLGGISLGLASITVATFLVLLPVAAVWMARKSGLRRGLVPFLVGAALPLAPVLLSNWIVSGEPVLVSYNGGVNFWIGNNADYERTVGVRPGRTWVVLINEPGRAGINSPSASSMYFFNKSARWIGAHPGRWLGLMLYKTRLFLRGDEIPRNQEIYPFRAASWLLRFLLWIRGLAFPLGLLWPLGVAGMVTRRQGGEEPRCLGTGLLLVAAAFLSLSVISFFVTARYRLPVVPLLILFAASGVSLWVPRIRARRLRGLIPPGIAFLLLALLANTGLPRMPKMFNDDAYSDLGTSYFLKGDLTKARREYETALGRNPENMEAAHNLGAIDLGQRRLDEAERRFRQVLAVYPEDANSLANLGSVAFFRGDPWLAGWYYSRVSKLDPRHPNIGENLRGVEGAASQAEAEGLRRDADGLLRRLESEYFADPRNDFLYPRLLRLLESRGDRRRALAVARARAGADANDDAARRDESRLGGPPGQAR